MIRDNDVRIEQDRFHQSKILTVLLYRIIGSNYFVIVVLRTHCSIIIIVLGRQHQLVVAQGTRSVPKNYKEYNYQSIFNYVK